MSDNCWTCISDSGIHSRDNVGSHDIHDIDNGNICGIFCSASDDGGLRGEREE